MVAPTKYLTADPKQARKNAQLARPKLEAPKGGNREKILRQALNELGNWCTEEPDVREDRSMVLAQQGIAGLVRRIEAANEIRREVLNSRFTPPRAR